MKTKLFLSLLFCLRGVIASADAGENLKAALHDYVTRSHAPLEGIYGELEDSCFRGRRPSKDLTDCFYYKAMDKLFNVVFLERQGSSAFLTDAYCGITEVVGENFLSLVYGDEYPLNVEHTWPQSRFNPAYPKNVQKSDLHHLFPTEKKINAHRGNFPFGSIDWENSPATFCEASKLGIGLRGGSEVFEPRDEHKGNVARAIFYFSIRYEMPIEQNEEHDLRVWHALDPVTPMDIERNEKIFMIQGNSNPFITNPELVEQIQDF